MFRLTELLSTKSSTIATRRRMLSLEAMEERRLLTGFPAQIGGVGFAIATDNIGHVFSGGSTGATDDLDPGPGSAFLNSGGFAGKYNTDGSLNWVRGIGGSVKDIQIDEVGNSYIVSTFIGTTQISGVDRLGDGSNAPYTGPTLTSHTVEVTNGKGKKATTQQVPQQDVVIAKLDPAGNVVWTAQFGGDGYVWGNRIAIHHDSTGVADGVFVTGAFSGTIDFDPGTGTQNRVSAGSEDAFIAKLDGQGNLAWSVRAGSTGNDAGRGITVTDDGSSYFTGWYEGSNPFGPGYPMVASGDNAGFMAKFDSGGSIEWVKSTAFGMQVIAAGQNIYFSGRTFTDYEGSAVTRGVVSELDSNGNVNWTKLLGTGGDSVGTFGITADEGGNLYAFGFYNGNLGTSVDFDPSSNEYLLPTYASGDNGFVVKLDSEGNFCGWATHIGLHVKGAIWDSFTGSLVTTGHYANNSEQISTRDTLGGQLPSTDSNWTGFVAMLRSDTGLPPGFAPNAPPMASAGAAQVGNEDESVTFDASGSNDPENDPLMYFWNFGDGQTAQSTSPTINHVYAYGGSFTATLTVNDGHGNQAISSTSATITEVNDLPVANIGGNYNGYDNQVITFDASASSDFDNLDGSDANNQPLTYYWDFGDGNSATTSSPTVDHVYTIADNYQLTLTVDDGVATSLPVVMNVGITAQPMDNSNVMYIYDIRFDSRRGGKDWRAVFEIRRDTDASGTANDVAATGVSITVVFDGIAYTGTTDSNGIFHTSWRTLSKGNAYSANVIDLTHGQYDWSLFDSVADLEDDTDGDGYPDDVLSL